MEENVFGIPMNLEPRAQVEARLAAGDTALYLVMRSADMYLNEYPDVIRKRLTIVNCPACQERCYLDPKAYLPGATIRCLHCAPKGLALNVTQETADEVSRLKREAE